MSAASATRAAIRRRVLTQMAGGVAVLSIPVSTWWYWARQERHAKWEDHRTAVRLPASAGSQDTYDYLITEKCEPGDILLFDRRPEHCASSPWAALSCLASRYFLTDPKDQFRSVDEGRFDHVGIIVPGYIKNKADAHDPTNLLLLEATPHGIVARPLKERLELSFSRSILLLQLSCPGERRNSDEDENDRPEIVRRARQHLEKELRQFRDRWTELGAEKKYQWIHSTVGLGGALNYGLGLQKYSSGPVSPAAYFVLMGLCKAAAAQTS